MYDEGATGYRPTLAQGRRGFTTVRQHWAGRQKSEGLKGN